MAYMGFNRFRDNNPPAVSAFTLNQRVYAPVNSSRLTRPYGGCCVPRHITSDNRRKYCLTRHSKLASGINCFGWPSFPILLPNMVRGVVWALRQEGWFLHPALLPHGWPFMQPPVHTTYPGGERHYIGQWLIRGSSCSHAVATLVSSATNSRCPRCKDGSPGQNCENMALWLGQVTAGPLSPGAGSGPGVAGGRRLREPPRLAPQLMAEPGGPRGELGLGPPASTPVRRLP